MRRALAIVLAGLSGLAVACRPTLPVRRPVAEVAVHAAESYPKTQGQEVAGAVAPWVVELAAASAISLDRLGHALGISDPGADPTQLLYQSPRHTTGSWTYVRGSFQIHQLEVVEIDGVAGRWLVVLVSSPPVDDTAAARWRLVLLDTTMKQQTSVELDAPLTPAIAGLWDSVTTQLLVDHGDLFAEVGYSHTGGGEPCDVVYSFHLHVVGSVPRPQLDEVAHKRDRCPVAGY